MDKKTRIEISIALKKKLDWQILQKKKDYDAHIWALIHWLEAYSIASDKYPNEMEKLKKIYRKRRAALNKKSSGQVVRVF